MIEAVITASVLILAVIAVRFLFRSRISRRLQYGLWVLVLIRLLIPVSLFASNISVMNALSVPQTANQQVYIGKLSETPVSETSTVTANDNGGLNDANSFGYNVLSEDGKTVTRYAEKTTVSDILKLVWLIGGIAVGLWYVIANFVFYMRLKKSRVPYTGEHSLPLKVYVSEGLASPCLFGLLRPAVYLTPPAVEETAFPYVCAHEYCHYRHGDHIWALFRGACLALYWWNPLVWAAAILSRRDSETACDEAAIKLMGEENRLIYGKTLVDMIALKPSSGFMCSATTMSGGKRAIKERLNLIISNRKTIIPAAIASLLIIAIAAGCAFTGAKTEKASYIYERWDLSLAVPSEYDGKIEFATTENLDDSTYLIAYHIPSKDKGMGGKLFTIVRHTHEEFGSYNEMIASFGGAIHFAEDDNFIYSIEHPTDVQTVQKYWRTNKDGSIDTSMSYLTKEDDIATDFIERNGLKPYQATESSSASDIAQPESTSDIDETSVEETYRPGGAPIICPSDDGNQTIYVTMITLRENSAMLNFIRGNNDDAIPKGLPDIAAVTSDGTVYKLNAMLYLTGAVCFECSNLPVDKISYVQVNVDKLCTPSQHKTDIFLKRLDDLPNMDYSELFSYCVGSDGAYSEGVYSEMAKRFIKNPEEFTVHFMMPAYPFANDYTKSYDALSMDNPSAFGFDETTKRSICYNVLYECLYELSPDELNEVIKTLSNSDYEIVRKAAVIFADVADELD